MVSVGAEKVAPTLSAETVENLVRFCLFSDAGVKGRGRAKAGSPDVPEGAVIVRGITMNVGFHPVRLEAKRAEVAALLGELPHQFREDEGGGGGWSFLNACEDRHGNQWGEHRDVEMLFLLGEALGLARPSISREAWPSLPGGMPYYVVTEEVA